MGNEATGMRGELIEAAAKAIDDLPVELHDYSACAEAALDAILARLNDRAETLAESTTDICEDQAFNLRAMLATIAAPGVG